MNKPKTHIAIVLLGFVLSGAATLRSAEEPKPKPYTLTTCAVCGMKLSDMGKP